MPFVFPLLVVAAVPAEGHARSRGTHLFAEVNLGLGIPPVTYLGPGFAYGGTFGIGGKFKGFPLRFYFIAGAGSVDFSGDGTHPFTGQDYSSDRVYADIYGGLRLLLPVYDQLRVYADFLAGAGYLEGAVQREDGPSVDKADWFAEGIVAAGLQYRWYEHASTGLRVETIFGGQDAELLDTFAGQGEGGGVRFSVMVTQTWHL